MCVCVCVVCVGVDMCGVCVCVCMSTIMVCVKFHRSGRASILLYRLGLSFELYS